MEVTPSPSKATKHTRPQWLVRQSRVRYSWPATKPHGLRHRDRTKGCARFASLAHRNRRRCDQPLPDDELITRPKATNSRATLFAAAKRHSGGLRRNRLSGERIDLPNAGLLAGLRADWRSRRLDAHFRDESRQDRRRTSLVSRSIRTAAINSRPTWPRPICLCHGCLAVIKGRRVSNRGRAPRPRIA